MLALAAPRVLAPRGLSQIYKYKTPHKCNQWGAKSNILHDHEHLNRIYPYKLFTKLPLAFLVF
jgi:hypothetical protein